MKINFIYWKDGDHWLGYIDEYPDYLSQGTSLEDLKINLKDLYSDLKSGEIPNIRKKGELEDQCFALPPKVEAKLCNPVTLKP